MSTRKKFADEFLLTCLAYEKEFKAELANLYFADLQRCGIDHVISALRSHRTDPDRGRFFPKVADVIYQIERASPKQDVKSLIALEWAKVIKAASSGRKPVTSDQSALAALQLIGGCNAVGYAEPVELDKLRRQFADNYIAITEAKPNQLPDHLENIEALTAQKTGLMKI